MQFQTEFEEYLYQYSSIKKYGPASITVLQNITDAFLLRHPSCKLESCIWGPDYMVVRVRWPDPNMKDLTDWNSSFYQHGQPVPLLDILEEDD